MKKQTFKDFLQDTHAELYPTVLDDDLSDSFDSWIGEMNNEELIDWGELYGRSQYIAGKAVILNEVPDLTGDIN